VKTEDGPKLDERDLNSELFSARLVVNDSVLVSTLTKESVFAVLDA